MPLMEATPAQLAEAMADAAEAVNAVLERLLPAPTGPEAVLHEAMRYAALGPGKRFRPFLVLTGARLCGVPDRHSLRAAAAVELIHAYSLVHDDLPAMDDDDLRRGRPTVHVRYDEATAILAGDALQALAFEALADSETHWDPEVRCELVSELAAAAGARGMVGGQMLDLKAQNEQLDVGAVARLERLKTGALIAFSCGAGAILARAKEDARAALYAYAHDIGFAFQIADDLLDAEGSEAETGKRVGKDGNAGKATVVGLLGIDGAREQARILAEQGVAHLELFGAEANLLRATARFVIERRA